MLLRSEGGMTQSLAVIAAIVFWLAIFAWLVPLPTIGLLHVIGAI